MLTRMRAKAPISAFVNGDGNHLLSSSEKWGGMTMFQGRLANTTGTADKTCPVRGTAGAGRTFYYKKAAGGAAQALSFHRPITGRRASSNDCNAMGDA
jgi:hypothetical protein